MSGAGGRGDGGGNTVDMDLQALVMGSESLLSHIARPDGIPRLTKSLAEIERGSLRMGAEASARSRREALSMGVTAEIAEQKQELKGGSMLAHNRFDPEGLTRVVNAVQLRGGYQPLQPLGETDIEGYLAHHHDMIVATAVDETRRAAEECSLVRQREWEVDSWRQTKKAMMGETMNGGISRGGRLEGGFGEGGHAGSGNAHETGRVHPVKPKSEDQQSLAVYTPPSASVIPAVTNAVQSMPVASRLTALEADHATVIRSHNATDEKFPLASKLAASAGKSVLGGVKSGPEYAYYTAWKILRFVLEPEGWELRGASTARSRLSGTFDFLEYQFQEVVENKVKKAREAGTLDASSRGDTATGLPPKVRAYMRLERSSESSAAAGPTLAGLPVWPQIFYCIRCGGRGDAADLALAAGNGGDCNDQERQLLTMVAGELKASGSHTDNLLRAFDSMRDGEDMFIQSVVNVVAAANDKKISRINKETIEDYMWFKLSFVRGNVDTSDVLEAAQERVSGKDGRRRFDPDGNNPFAYVNVLLYTQQFEAAVSFLHWKGFHLAALHMALALDYHNAYAGHGDPSVTSYPGVREEPGPAPSLRELVECCTRGRVDSDPEVCAEYMLLLPVPVAVDCLSSLAVSMGATKAVRLLGHVKTDGSLEKGDLDRSLTEETIEEVAFAAGQKAESQGRRADALTFYGLSCDWERMSVLLAFELADRLHANAENRAFWKELGTKVHNMLVRISEGTAVPEARELATSGVRQMLSLMGFFDQLHNKDLEKAVHELEAAGMLPSSLNDAAQLAARIRLRGTGDSIIAVLPKALETGMQCLRHHHLEVKRELHTNAPSRIDPQEWRASREKKLAELEEKGRAMVALAGRISDLLPASFVADLSRLEANIVN